MKTLEVFTKIKNKMKRIPGKLNDIIDNELKVILTIDRYSLSKKDVLYALNEIQ